MGAPRVDPLTFNSWASTPVRAPKLFPRCSILLYPVLVPVPGFHCCAERALDVGPAFDDCLGDIEAGKVLDKQACQLSRLGIVGVFVRPRFPGVQVGRVDPGYGHWEVQIQHRQVLGFNIVERAVLNGADDGPGYWNREA